MARVCIIRVVRTKEPFFPLEIVYPSKNRSYFNGSPILKWNVNKQYDRKQCYGKNMSLLLSAIEYFNTKSDAQMALNV